MVPMMLLFHLFE